MNYIDPSGHWKLGQWLGKILGAIAGVATAVVTGNPVLGFQVYSAVSSVYDTGYALAHGADPLRTIGAFVAANVLSAVMPGVPGGLQGDLFAQIAIGAARGAVIGGVSAAIGGSDIGQGALWGAGTGAAIGFASSQQFQNAIHGNGFVSNTQRQQTLARANELKAAGKLDQATLAERSALSGGSILDGLSEIAPNEHDLGLEAYGTALLTALDQVPAMQAATPLGEIGSFTVYFERFTGDNVIITKTGTPVPGGADPRSYFMMRVHGTNPDKNLYWTAGAK